MIVIIIVIVIFNYNYSQLWPLEQICRHLSVENLKYVTGTGVSLKCYSLGGKDNCTMLKSNEIAIVKFFDKNIDVMIL